MLGRLQLLQNKSDEDYLGVAKREAIMIGLQVGVSGCYGVLQGLAGCCMVLQGVAVCYSCCRTSQMKTIWELQNVRLV